jgi:hypothetical protein
MARKIAELFSFNRGIRPFYTACCFDVLGRGSMLCLLNASFETAVSQRHLIFEPELMIMASDGAIRGEYSHNGSIQWHLVKPPTCFIG